MERAVRGERERSEQSNHEPTTTRCPTLADVQPFNRVPSARLRTNVDHPPHDAHTNQRRLTSVCMTWSCVLMVCAFA
jgi:hypothetical protein